MTVIRDTSELQIVFYPHPVLRRKSKPVKRVDSQLKTTVHRMFELMYEAEGIGLAANQVGLPLRFFVVNLAAKPGEGADYVFINPVLSRPKGLEEMEEGCLSFPDLRGMITRPKRIHLSAFGLDGRAFEADLDGMMARVVQHENDHLDGVVFPDRLSTTGLAAAEPVLDEFEVDFSSRQRLGQVPADAVIEAEALQWELRYC